MLLDFHKVVTYIQSFRSVSIFPLSAGTSKSRHAFNFVKINFVKINFVKINFVKIKSCIIDNKVLFTL